MKRLLTTFFILILSISAFGRGAVPLSKSGLMRRLQDWEAELRDWKANPEERLEKDAEIEWIYRLRSAVQANYSESDASLLRIIEGLKEVENLPENISTSRLIPFLNFLLKALREEREPTEPMFDFIQETTETGTILNPPTLAELSSTRDYRSCGLSEAAAAYDLEEAAESLDVGELSKPVQAELAPEPAVLHAAKGDVGVGTDKVVPSDKSALQPASDTPSPIGVPGEDSTSQPVNGQVRQL